MMPSFPLRIALLWPIISDHYRIRISKCRTLSFSMEKVQRSNPPLSMISVQTSMWEVLDPLSTHSRE